LTHTFHIQDGWQLHHLAKTAASCLPQLYSRVETDDSYGTAYYYTSSTADSPGTAIWNIIFFWDRQLSLTARQAWKKLPRMYSKQSLLTFLNSCLLRLEQIMVLWKIHTIYSCWTAECILSMLLIRLEQLIFFGELSRIGRIGDIPTLGKRLTYAARAGDILGKAVGQSP
jgi:hypothetical protein